MDYYSKSHGNSSSVMEGCILSSQMGMFLSCFIGIPLISMQHLSLEQLADSLGFGWFTWLFSQLIWIAVVSCYMIPAVWLSKKLGVLNIFSLLVLGCLPAFGVGEISETYFSFESKVALMIGVSTAMIYYFLYVRPINEAKQAGTH